MALFTQTSIGPSSASTRAAAASTASLSATSVGSTRARPPRASTSWRAFSKASRLRATRPMWAPCSAKARTVARPTPAEAPVITTISGFLLLMLIPPLASRLERPDGGPGQQGAAGQPRGRPADAGPVLFDGKVFGEIPGRTVRPFAQGHPQDLRGMQRPAAGLLGDLLAATEAGGNDQGVFGCLAHGGEEHLFADRDRDV